MSTINPQTAPNLNAPLQVAPGTTTTASKLLGGMAKPKVLPEVEEGFGTLVKILLGKTGVQVVPNNLQRTIQAAIGFLDRTLTSQVNEILHNPQFQKLESAWRGLHHLCNHTVTDETLRIRVLNVSKDELGKSLEKFSGDAEWDKSPLYKKLHRNTFSQPGTKGDAAPFGVLIGDYEFTHEYEDVQMLRDVAKVCASCHCPFLSSVSPELMGLDSWTELPDPDNLTQKLSTQAHAAWNDLRELEDARYLAMTMPRFLARMPYGQKGIKTEAFAFEEEMEAAHHDRFLWANSAYAMGVNITRAFKASGWPVQIRGKQSGGEVDNLPLHTFETLHGSDVKCPSESAIDMRREAELSANGLMPLVWFSGETNAAFIGGQTLKRPTKYSTSEANKNEKLGARLPYVLACSRFAHYLKKMVYEKVGATKLPGEDWSSVNGVRDTLQNWINLYVCPDPKLAAEQQLAEKPLAAAEVRVEEDPDNPGMYSAQFFIRPHYQFEGLDVTLHLVAELPTSTNS